MKASDYIADYLKSLGIKTVYGYTGGAITHTIDSFCTRGMRFRNFNHEQGAIFAASGATKVDHQLRVIVVTSGPGATNLITGIGEAYFDSVPILIISGQVNTYDFKWDKKCRQLGFQETDIVSVVRPITKYAKLIDDAQQIPAELHRAVSIALDGRPGPVVLDIPMNLQRADIDVPAEMPAPTLTDTTVKDADIEYVVKCLESAKAPLILLGNGCKIAEARQELLKMMDKLHIPVVVSLLGKGSIPEDHADFLGFIGSYGNRYANIALAKADTILVLGSRLDSRQTGNKRDLYKGKTIVQVDIDNDEIGVNLAVTKSLLVDVRVFLRALNGRLRRAPARIAVDRWNDFLKRLRSTFTPMSELVRAKAESFQYEAMQAISDHMASDAVACADIGQVQMIAAQALSLREEQQFVTSGGMAPMGYALPAAIGIALETGRKTISINGDGGMQMNIQEINILAKMRAPVLIIVFDNKALGMIKQFQELYFDQRYYGTDEKNGYFSCDFAAIAEAYGVPAMRIRHDDPDWRQKIDDAFSRKWPFLVHITLDYETKVFPKLRFDRTIDDPEPQIAPEEQSLVDGFLSALDEGKKEAKGVNAADAYYDG